MERKSQVLKYLAEGALIIFSVLFALFINRASERAKVKRQKQVAVKSIIQEMEQNNMILEDWIVRHGEIRERLDQLVAGTNDSLRRELTQYSYLNLGVLTANNSLVDAMLTNTAWETAKSTNIVAEFDFATMQKLTHVYSMQEVINNGTITKIVDLYFSTEAHDMENIDPILVQFQLRFWELIGQETLMEQLYQEALQALGEGSAS